MRILSNNQWRHDDNTSAWSERGEDCSAEHREKGFSEVYAKLLPDAVGLQEVSPRMLDCLMRELQNKGLRYAALWGRDTPILYRSDRLELIDSDFGIYPAECPGFSGCFNNEDTKSYCVAVFREKQLEKLFILATTHLWWKADPSESRKTHNPDGIQEGSNAARVYQMGIVLDRTEEFIRKYQCPAVLMGDMNCVYGSEPIRLAESRGYTHANRAASGYAYPYHGYHWCASDGFGPYDPKPWETAIDHILIKGAITVSRMDRYVGDDYLRLSDHFPAYIDTE